MMEPIFDFYERLYLAEGMDFFLEDDDMKINSLVYNRMTRSLNKAVTISFEEYFRYAYAVCAKLNTDKYPESHFKDEYWAELPDANHHRIIIMGMVYMLIAFQRSPRVQYPKMMNAIFDWRLDGQWASSSHDILKMFLPVIEKCLKVKKHSFWALVPGEKMLNKKDKSQIAECAKEFEVNFKAGNPENQEEAQALMKEMQDTLLGHMMDLEKEKEEAKKAKEAPAPEPTDAKPKADEAKPDATANEFKIALKGKFAQVIHIMCRMGVITDENGKPASPQKLATKLGPIFGEDFNRFDSSVNRAYEQENRMEIFNDMHTAAQNYQKEREERKKR